MKQPEPDNCMTYVQGVTDTTPKPLTRQRLEALLDSEQTRELVQRCRAEKDENRQNRIKAMLPAVMFNGLFSQQDSARYMTSPTRTKPTLRDAPNYIPSGLYGVDIDEDCNPRELFRKAGMAIKERLRIQPAQVVAMAYESPRRGLRLVVKRQRGLTIAQEQERWDRLLGLPCDKKCKDLGRLYFLTSREQLIYYNPELLFPSTPPAKEDFPPDEATAMPDTATQGLTIDKQTPAGTAIHLPPAPDITHYDGIPLEDIVEELQHTVGGGEAMQGNRNAQVFEMAGLLRHITGPNHTLLHTLIPTYGLSALEHQRTISNALRRTPLPYLPQDLQRAIERLKSHTSATPQTTAGHYGEMPPAMPAILPQAIECLISATPQTSRPAVAMGVFSPLRIHLHEVSFHYINNMDTEPAFMNLLIAGQTEGKTAMRQPIDHILAPIAQADRDSREKEDAWREECSTLGATKNKPKPPRMPIRIVQPDMTNPALVKRARDAAGDSLYTYAEELEKLRRLQGLSEIIRTAFDVETYGQERVGAQSISDVVKLRWCFNVSTTPHTARNTFRSNLTDGTLARLALSTIQSDPDDWGEALPVYGNYGPAYDDMIKPYIDRLAQAKGVIHCPQAEQWAERERLRQIDILREKDARHHKPFLFRSLIMGFWRACMLYIMHGYRWSQEIELFASWTVDYDLWCKFHFFGDMIENATQSTAPDNARYNTSLLALLPDTFTREQARNMRRDIGKGTSAREVRCMLGQWTHRGFIRLDEKQGIYVKIQKQRLLSS